MELSVANVMKAVKDPRLEALIQEMITFGVTKASLEGSLERDLGTSMGPDRELARMNFIGALRGAGWVVTGGRGGGGRKALYQIVGWEAKVAALLASEWTGVPRSVLDSYDRLPTVEERQPQITLGLEFRPHVHETSFLYLYGYEMARAQGRFMSTSGGSCVILKKFDNAPRFSIFQLDMSPTGLRDQIAFWSQASLGPVQVINLHPSEASILREKDRQGQIIKRRQARYHTPSVAEAILPSQYEKWMSKTQWNLLRKHERENRWSMHLEQPLGEFVINTWRSINEPKHRQLAIGRDYRALGINAPTKFQFGGSTWSDELEAYRALGICIYDRLPMKARSVSHIVEKSINYRPIGRPGMSDYMIWRSCQVFAGAGLEWILAGAYEGGGAGLPHHKARWAKPENDIHSITFRSSVPFHVPQRST